MSTKQSQIDKLITARENGQSICFVSGNFNIIHPGHLRFLLFAAEQADILVVGVNDRDSSVGAIFSNHERKMALSALSFVDEALVLDCALSSIIDVLKPDVIVKGKEFENSENVEQELVEKYGGKLIFSSGEKQFSSRELLQQQLQEHTQLQQHLQRYHDQHRIDSKELEHFISSFEKLNVAVIGDIIVDEYQECLPIGMSQEDPTIAVSPLESFQYLGGAGIVAGHARSLGATVHFLSVTGNDTAGKFAQQKLKQYDVNAFIVEDESRPTTHKLRYRAKDKTLLRVNSYRRHAVDGPVIKQLLTYFEKHIDEFDAVIFADFSFGVLCPAVIKKISTLCIQRNIPMVADSQTSSQIGDLTKFKHLLLSTPTEVEARLATQDDDNGLIQVSQDLAVKLDSQNLIVTLGAEGVLIRHYNEKTQTLETDNLPAIADNAVDTAGAGDALFVTATLMLCAGADIWQAAFVGNVSSAIQVKTRGNLPIPKRKVVNQIKELLG